jgi:hypothetical protein
VPSTVFRDLRKGHDNFPTRLGTLSKGTDQHSTHEDVCVCVYVCLCVCERERERERERMRERESQLLSK